jgi:hypothetical protein
MTIASSRPNTGRVSLQELHGIGSPVVTRTSIRPEARWPCRTTKGPGERREAPKAEDADLWLTIPNGLQAIKDLETFSATARVDSTKAKTVMTIVTHVDADLEGRHTTAPYLARQMSMDFVSQEHGVPHDGPKDSNAGG